jgi:hypothetical protein
VIGEIERWHLIVDEIPPADIFFPMHLPVNHRFLSDAIKLVQPSADTSHIQVTDEKLLERYANNKEIDDIDAQFQTIAQHLLSDHHEMFALNGNYERTVRGDTEQGKYPLYLYGILQPSIFQDFKSTTIMGACLGESLLYQLWSNAGVVFEPHEEITKNLRYTEHANGDRLEIYYLTDEKWSKKYASKSDDVASNNEIALNATKTVFGEERLYTTHVTANWGMKMDRLLIEMVSRKSAWGRVSRVTSVQTALRNCIKDEGGPFGFGRQGLIPSHCKLLSLRAMVVSVAETSGQ